MLTDSPADAPAAEVVSAKLSPAAGSDNKSPAASDRASSWEWWVLAAILLLAAGVRLWQIHDSLWLDELNTAWTIAGGWGDLPRRAAMGNHSPAYFVLPMLSVKLLGLSELSLRLPSLLAGLALIAVLFAAVREWTHSASAALFAALLAALDRNCIFYSQEARAYACVQLVGLINVLLFSRLLTVPMLRLRLGWIATAILLFYLHFTSGLLLAAEAVCFACLWFRPKCRPDYRLEQFFVDGLLVVLACRPAWTLLVEIAGRRENWSLFIGEPTVDELWTRLPLIPYLAIPTVAAASGWCAARVLRRATDERTSSFDGRKVTLVVFWLLLPLVSAWSLTYAGVAMIFIARYLAASIVAPLALAAILLACCPRGIVRAAVAIGVVAVAFYYSGMGQQFRFDGRLLADRSQDWRAAVAYINQAEPQRRLPVFVRSGYIEANGLRGDDRESRQQQELREFYLAPVTTIYRLDRDPDLIQPLPTFFIWDVTNAQWQQFDQAGEAWFVSVGWSIVDGEGQGEMVPFHGQNILPLVRLEESRSFGAVHVVRLRSPKVQRAD